MIPKIQSKATYSISKHQAKRTSHRISSKLKSQILAEILSPNSSIPHIAKQLGLTQVPPSNLQNNYQNRNCQNFINQ